LRHGVLRVLCRSVCWFYPKNTKKLFLNVCCVFVYSVFCYVLCVFCTGHFVMVPINLTCPHCLQHFFSEHLFHLYWHIYIVYKILSLNISLIYILSFNVWEERKARLIYMLSNKKNSIWHHWFNVFGMTFFVITHTTSHIRGELSTNEPPLRCLFHRCTIHQRLSKQLLNKWHFFRRAIPGN